jgi:hypothetical protein
MLKLSRPTSFMQFLTGAGVSIANFGIEPRFHGRLQPQKPVSPGGNVSEGATDVFGGCAPVQAIHAKRQWSRRRVRRTNKRESPTLTMRPRSTHHNPAMGGWCCPLARRWERGRCCQTSSDFLTPLLPPEEAREKKHWHSREPRTGTKP